MCLIWRLSNAGFRRAPVASRQHFWTGPCCWQCLPLPRYAATRPNLHPPASRISFRLIQWQGSATYCAIIWHWSAMHKKFAREGFLPLQTHWLAALQLLCLLQPVEDRIYTRSDVSYTSHGHKCYFTKLHLNNSSLLVELCPFNQKPGLFRLLLSNLLLLNSCCELPNKLKNQSLFWTNSTGTFQR